MTDEQRFPGNSNSRRVVSRVTPGGEKEEIQSEAPKLAPAKIVGTVSRRKKTFGRRVHELFLGGGEESGGVLKYLFQDVLVPAVRDLVVDFVVQGVERSVYGQSRSTPRTRSSTGFRTTSQPRTHISYDQQSTMMRSRLSGPPTPQRRSIASPQMEVDDILVKHHVDAEVIVDGLNDLLEEYGQATVANLKELLNESAVPTDHKWGWDADAAFGIQRVTGGFVIVLPKPIVLR